MDIKTDFGTKKGPKKDQKRYKNHSVIPYLASLGKIKIPDLKYMISGPKRDQKRIQNRSVISYKAWVGEMKIPGPK